MTKEEKQLLLKDLCMRVPYGPKVKVLHVWNEEKEIEEDIVDAVYCVLPDGYINTETIDSDIPLNDNIVLYLRPMSSMTEEEVEEYRNLSDEVIGSYGPYHREFIAHCVRLGIKPDDPHECVDDFLNMEAIDWLNEHHFDYRSLIEKGLALEAPEDMYKI